MCTSHAVLSPFLSPPQNAAWTILILITLCPDSVSLLQRQQKPLPAVCRSHCEDDTSVSAHRDEPSVHFDVTCPCEGKVKIINVGPIDELAGGHGLGVGGKGFCAGFCGRVLRRRPKGFVQFVWVKQHGSSSHEEAVELKTSLAGSWLSHSLLSVLHLQI